MNDDELEKKLPTLSSAAKGADPTPAWRAEILSRALSEAHLARSKKRMLPPRWLMVSWGAAWAAAVVFNLAAPDSAMHLPEKERGATSTAPLPPEAFLAYTRQLTLNLNPPE